MSEFAQYLLDLLGEIGGGRGDPADDLTRFTLGLIFWLLLIGSAITIRHLQPTRTVTLALIGMSLGASRELLMLVSHSLVLYDVVALETMSRFVPTLDHALLSSARIVIASAFLFYRLDDRTVARRYLQIGVSLAVVIVLVADVYWPRPPTSGLHLHFDASALGWLIHGWGLLTMGLAVSLLARTERPRPYVVCVPFVLFLLDDLLSIVNIITAHTHSSMLAPIAQTSHILALPWFGYLYWREQIDEQARLSAKLVESERLEVVGQLAAGMAHDFNNHLQAILGHAQMPVNTQADVESARARFKGISDSVEHASRLVHRLLAFRRDQGGDQIEDLELNEVIESLAPMLKGLLTESQSLSWRLDAQPSRIRADRSTLEQSIVNLLTNARDAMPDGGDVELSTSLIHAEGAMSTEGSMVRLSVRDSGCGMDGLSVKRAFEPFFTTKGVGKGTGLGLAAIYNDLHRLGGRASIASKPGFGTTVRLDFPALASSPPQPTTRNSPPRTASVARSGDAIGRRILLAEGNATVRHSAAAQLRSAGYRVVAVANGEAAIQGMQGTSDPAIDLLMLDIAMPRIGGYNAFDILSNQLGPLPVIFLLDQSQKASSHHTMHPHLIKPFHRNQLLRSVESVLDRAFRSGP